MEKKRKLSNGASTGTGASSGKGGGVLAHDEVTLGMRVIVRKTERNQERVGKRANIIHIPNLPNTWFKIRFDDGVEIRVRRSGFRAITESDSESESESKDVEDKKEEGKEVEAKDNDDDKADMDEAKEDDSKSKNSDNGNKRLSSSSSGGETSFGFDKACLQVGKRVKIRETSNVRHRVSHLIGELGTITDVPVHPNTWYRVEVDGSSTPIKFQATALLPVDASGNPEISHNKDEDSEEDEIPTLTSQSASRKPGRGRPKATSPDIVSKAKIPPTTYTLSETDPNLWVGVSVIISSGALIGEVATILKSGNGWVQLRIEETGQEFARRAYELIVPKGSPLLDEDGKPALNTTLDDGTASSPTKASAKRRGANRRVVEEDQENESDASVIGSRWARKRSRRGAKRSNSKGIEEGISDEELGKAVSEDDDDDDDDDNDSRPRRTSARNRANTEDDTGSETRSTVTSSSKKDKRKSKTTVLNSPLSGRDIVISNGVYKGIVGNIESGNGYFYINTVEENRVRKKREQFQILEPIDELFAIVAKTLPNQDMEQCKSVKIVIDERPTDGQLVSFSPNYFCIECNDSLYARLHTEVHFNLDIPGETVMAILDQAGAGRKGVSSSHEARENSKETTAKTESLYATKGTRKRSHATEESMLDDLDRNSTVMVRGEEKRRIGTRGSRKVAMKNKAAKPVKLHGIPLTDDPAINELLQTNRCRNELVVAWMNSEHFKSRKYNQHRPNLALWLERICGDDEQEDEYVAPIAKTFFCGVCKLEKKERWSSCWNPGCWKSPVFQPGALPLEQAVPSQDYPNYVFAVAQSPRKPGYIDVPETEFPFAFSKSDQMDHKPEEESKKSKTSKGWSVAVADQAVMSGWSRFVAGRKRIEEETICSPLETYHYRAQPITIGRKKRPLDTARDSGLNGYFGKGWNEDLARPMHEVSVPLLSKENKSIAAEIRRSKLSKAILPSSKLSNSDTESVMNEDDDQTDDLTGLDYRWRSWEDQIDKGAAEPPHPTMDAAASLMSIGVEGIDSAQFETLNKEKSDILKEVNAKLAKDAPPEEQLAINSFPIKRAYVHNNKANSTKSKKAKLAKKQSEAQTQDTLEDIPKLEIPGLTESQIQGLSQSQIEQLYHYHIQQQQQQQAQLQQLLQQNVTNGINGQFSGSQPLESIMQQLLVANQSPNQDAGSTFGTGSPDFGVNLAHMLNSNPLALRRVLEHVTNQQMQQQQHQQQQQQQQQQHNLLQQFEELARYTQQQQDQYFLQLNQQQQQQGK